MSTDMSTGDIARARGIDRKTAYRWLCELEERHGPSVVARRGRKLYTTEAALERVAPAWRGEETVDERLHVLEQRIEELETFRRQARAWLQRGVAGREGAPKH